MVFGMNRLTYKKSRRRHLIDGLSTFGACFLPLVLDQPFAYALELVSPGQRSGDGGLAGLHRSNTYAHIPMSRVRKVADCRSCKLRRTVSSGDRS
jgi:hypothetical protein